VVGTAVIQAVIMGIGLAVAGVPGAVLLGFVTLLLALSQIGAPLIIVVWGGAAVWLFGQDQQGWGIFMIFWGLVVTVIDNFIKPLLIGAGVAMPMLCRVRLPRTVHWTDTDRRRVHTARGLAR